MVEVRLLREVSVSGDRDPCFLGGAQAQLVFARLILDRVSGVSRGQLADTLWPEELPHSWHSALRNVLTRVRSFARSAGLEMNSRDGLVFLECDRTVSVDFEKAEHAIEQCSDLLSTGQGERALDLAERAVTILRGQFLPLNEGPWVEENRRRVRELMLVSLELSGEASLQTGRYRSAVGRCEEAMRIDPNHEGAHRTLMRAQMLSGNRAAALATFHRLKRALADEFGTSPTVETADVYFGVLGAYSPEQLRHPNPSRRVPFSGRPGTILAMDKAWDRVRREGPEILAIFGTVALGKSRSIFEFAKQITLQGYPTLLLDGGRSTPSEPLLPFIDAIRSYIEATPDDMVPRVSALSTRAVTLMLASDYDPNQPGNKNSLVVALTEFFHALVRIQPAVLLIDDLELLDDASIALLRALFASSGLAHLLVIATRGTKAPVSTSLDSFLTDLRVSRHLTEQTLQPLTVQEIRQLQQEICKSARTQTRMAPFDLWQLSGGNPFLAIELIEWGIEHPDRSDEVPASVVAFLEAQLNRLDGQTALFLRRAAFACQPLSSRVVSAACNFSASQHDSVISTLTNHKLLRSCGLDRNSYEFEQPIFLRAIRLREGTVSVADHHCAIADAIARLGGPEDNELGHRVAAAKAGVFSESVPHLLRAALLASPLDALVLTGRAVEQLDVRSDPSVRCHALIQLGVAKRHVGDPSAFSPLIEGGLLALKIGRPELSLQAAFELLAIDRTEVAILLMDEVLDMIARDSGASNGLAPVSLARMVVAKTANGGTVESKVHDLATKGVVAEISRLAGPFRGSERRDLGALLAQLGHGEVTLRMLAHHHLAMGQAFLGLNSASHDSLQLLIATGYTGGLVDDYRSARGKPRFAPRNGQEEPTVFENLVPPPGSLVNVNVATLPLIGSAVDESYIVTEAPLNIAYSGLRSLRRGLFGAASIELHRIAALLHEPPCDLYTHVLGIGALLAVETKDSFLAHAFDEALRPFDGVLAGSGYRSYVGPVSLFRGLIASMNGEWEAGEILLESAIRQATEAGVPFWTAYGQKALADLMELRGRPNDVRWVNFLRSECDGLNDRHIGSNHSPAVEAIPVARSLRSVS